MSDISAVDNKKEADKVSTALDKAKWTTSALIFPTSVNKAMVYAATWFVLQPAALMLFPRAETVLQEEGLNPALVQELAPGRDVYVRGNNFLGKAHAALDYGPLWAPYMLATAIYKKEVSAYTLHSPSKVFNNVCSVYLSSENMMEGSKENEYINELISHASGGKSGFSSPVSPKEYRQMALLHEITHCSADNKRLEPILRESDADYHAIEALARETKKPQLKEAFLLKRGAMLPAPNNNSHAIHDTALYIDAQLRHVATPSAEEMDKANKEAAPINEGVLYKKLDIAAGKCKENPSSYICNYNPITLDMSPLTARRVELFSKGWDRFLHAKKPSVKPSFPVS